MASKGGVFRKPNPWATAIVAVIVALFFSFPYVVMVISSLKTRSEITQQPPDYLPASPQWVNYLDVWSYQAVNPGQALLSSIVVALGATILVLFVATPASYYVARFRFPGRMAFLLLVLITQMLQPTVLAIGLYVEFVQWKGYLVWGALILINAAFNLSFAVWIMQSFFASVPKEIDEAAMLDGLGRLQTMFRVSLPLVWPGIVTAIIFVFVNTWNEYAAAFVLRNDKFQTLPVAIPSFLGQYVKEWHFMFATAVVAMIPVIILFAMIEKRLIGGLTAGAVK